MTAAAPGAPGAPIPVPDRDTQPFWDAAHQRRLVVPRCGSCGAWVWQPKPICPRCHADALAWTDVAGRGRVASWTVLRPPVLAAWADLVPFVVLLVELDEGVRMVGQLVGDDAALLQTDGEAEGVGFGAPVEVRWREEGDFVLPAWTLLTGQVAPSTAA